MYITLFININLKSFIIIVNKRTEILWRF